MEFILDSYAWVEYFIGSKKGEIIKKLFSDDNNKFFTVECCLAEIVGWALKNNQDFDKLFSILRANSEILTLTEYNWIDAGKERFVQRKKQKNFGLIDATILVKRKDLGCKVITGDFHFKGLKNIVFLE